MPAKLHLRSGARELMWWSNASLHPSQQRLRASVTLLPAMKAQRRVENRVESAQEEAHFGIHFQLFMSSLPNISTLAILISTSKAPQITVGAMCGNSTETLIVLKLLGPPR